MVYVNVSGAKKRRRLGAGLCLAMIGVVSVGCSVQAIERDLGIDENSRTCSEYTASGTVDAKLDVEVKAFMEASADFERVSGEIRASVKQACTQICVDLGESAAVASLGDDDDAISNSQGTGACDVASAKLNAMLEAHAQANFALSVVRGGCRTDYEEIKQCDTLCKDVETCDSGSVEERCTPGEVTVVCDGKCQAEAECKGTIEVAANCNGRCEAQCEGECKGTATSRDGKKTENDGQCNGKCKGTCIGKCKGTCKVEAQGGIECGANVRCKGSCEGVRGDPVCETHVTPPKCTVKQSCYEACTSRVEAKRVCEPTRVELYADASVHADVQKVVATVNANLSILVDAAEVKGRLALDSVERLGATGKLVASSSSKIDVKAQSCTAAAVKTAGTAAARMKASVTGGAKVVESCRTHSG